MHDPRFLPGGAKYDDLPGMLTVAAPAPLWLADEEKLLSRLDAKAFKVTNAGDKRSPDDAVSWLLDN